VRTLRGRLFAMTLLAVLLSIVLTLVVGAVLVRHSLERSILSNLGREGALVAVREEAQPVGRAVPRNLRALLEARGIRLAILQLPLAGHALLTAGQVEAINSGQAVQGKVRTARGSFLFAVEPAGNEAVLLFRTADLDTGDYRPFVGGFLIAGLIGAALAALLSFLLAKAIARPVHQVAEASRSLTAGQQPAVIPVEGSDELALLARSFNDMAAQLRRAREAEQAFLLSVSHELKTPLTAIKGYAEALEEEAVTAKEGGEVISSEASRLERLVQDLLDLARMNQRAFTVRRELIDLGSVARQTVRRYEQRAKAFEVALFAEGPDPSPAVADPDRTMQVVSNLVENALRCTPVGGSVVLSAAPGELAVRDSGPGLDEQDLPQAFERFFLYDRYGGQRPVGSGLGLALVKELTEAMGGTVMVQSSPGHGAVFTVRLPQPPAQPAEAQPITGRGRAPGI
jgi:two-component system OmpR family sensor kinase